MEQQVLTRNDLYDMVWSETMTSLSKKYNVSDTGLRKICKRLNTPLPKLGHWQRMLHGKKIIRQPLPEDTKVDQHVTLALRDKSITDTASTSFLKALICLAAANVFTKHFSTILWNYMHLIKRLQR